ncbi:MAG: hypothetical protein Q8P78_02870 [bacterium]|nr:hypothetical protein [bacterium]
MFSAQPCGTEQYARLVARVLVQIQLCLGYLGVLVHIINPICFTAKKQ